jgi:hypothetical protein
VPASASTMADASTTTSATGRGSHLVAGGVQCVKRLGVRDLCRLHASDGVEPAVGVALGQRRIFMPSSVLMYSPSKRLHIEMFRASLIETTPYGTQRPPRRGHRTWPFSSHNTRRRGAF